MPLTKGKGQEMNIKHSTEREANEVFKTRRILSPKRFAVPGSWIRARLSALCPPT
jgi:hypothetical protein